MTKLQEEINALAANQVVDYYNKWATHHGEDTVAKFKTLKLGREACYNLQWRNGMDEEAPKPSDKEEVQAKTNGGEKPAKASAKAKEKAKPASKGKAPSKEKAATGKAPKAAKGPQEKGPLGSRPGTLKHNLIEALLDAKGKPLALKSLSKKLYGEEGKVASLKMVLLGVEHACKVDPRYVLHLDKESASLETKTR